MYFTFHDVSINTHALNHTTPLQETLHSTMFLLIPLLLIMYLYQLQTLHSTMFLLILVNIAKQLYNTIFTFHDVSINTGLVADAMKDVQTLHSTMFLLIPVVYLSLQYRYNLTTFCQSCHFIIFILIFIFLDSSHF